ncbi:hypothetical protein [Aliiroseovarius lamellibrachiae]|uniref:hypothetical protein n=1 Tax=Aliiroseovarius lamellibrachiae TaxID=1924933 RepID=UPI001BE02C18|nr:hypothetical protein [Aliiroseovarius lamellibrachiae]MBT2132513.1 hypothetical protein [Aliiroseovarius lamellibrachiae]
MKHPFFALGWARFPTEKSIEHWVAQVREHALAATEDPHQQTHWLRAGGTWFVGVNALENDGEGRVENGPAIGGQLFEFIDETYGWHALDKGQISITYPGYPKQDKDESDAAHRFRKNRDAAHLDGVKPELSNGRRCVDETHGYVIGIPLNFTSEDASPLVVWEGSHHVMRRAMLTAFYGVAPKDMRRHDITEAYVNARKKVFESCPRRVVHATPGEAYLMHRFTLHGVAPWGAKAVAPPEGRMVAYFRPDLPGGVKDWLSLP